MTGCESMLQNDIEWMLYAGKTLGGIVILIVYVEVVVLDGAAPLFAQKIFLYKRFGGV